MPRWFLIPGYNYAGPFNPFDDEYVNSHAPVNQLDWLAYNHDRAYAHALRNGASSVDVYLRFQEADADLIRGIRAARNSGQFRSQTEYVWSIVMEGLFTAKKEAQLEFTPSFYLFQVLERFENLVEDIFSGVEDSPPPMERPDWYIEFLNAQARENEEKKMDVAPESTKRPSVDLKGVGGLGEYVYEWYNSFILGKKGSEPPRKQQKVIIRPTAHRIKHPWHHFIEGKVHTKYRDMHRASPIELFIKP